MSGEIGAWSRMTREDRRRVMDMLEVRRPMLTKRRAGGPEFVAGRGTG